MGLVVLSGVGIEHRYVVGAIADALAADLDAIIVADPPKRSWRQTVAMYRRRYTYRQIGSRLVASVYRRLTGAGRHREATLTRILFPDGDPGSLPRPDLQRAVQSHNGPECLALLEELQPDVIAVYGTAIIKAPVIRMAGTGIFNMHTGISPRYRGTDTTFWPLHNEEPEWIGVTVHELDEGIDSGAILRIERPDIDPDDDDASLFAKCVRVGAPRYVEVLRDALEGKVVGEPQLLEEGRNYLGVERTVGAELRVRRLLRRGLLAASRR